MKLLTDLAHESVERVLRRGETAVDATMGNGHDTAFLAKTVGSNGTVIAFDLQSPAIAATAHRLSQLELQNVRLVQRCHSKLAEEVPAELHGRLGAVMFNLGYLPTGDKSLVTQTSTTLQAIQTSLSLLREGGMLTVIAYRAHPGGMHETDAVAESLASLPSTFQVTCESPKRPGAPRLFIVTAPTRDSTPESTRVFPHLDTL